MPRHKSDRQKLETAARKGLSELEFRQWLDRRESRERRKRELQATRVATNKNWKSFDRKGGIRREGDTGRSPHGPVRRIPVPANPLPALALEPTF
jgi:hypothetical protein